MPDTSVITTPTSAAGNTAEPVTLTEFARRDWPVTGPFHPRTTLHKPSHFPSPFERAKPGEYLFVTDVGGHVLGGRAAFAGDGADTVALALYAPADTEPPADPDAAVAEIARRLGLTLDLPGYGDLWWSDPILSSLPAQMCGARPVSPFTLYEFLTICTLLQNTQVGRTVQMARTLADTLGTAYRFPTGDVLTSFWPPARLLALGETALRERKLGYRAKTLVRSAADFTDRPDLQSDLLAHTADPARLRAELTGLYGVGPASVGYVMFEWFKNLAEFSHVSPWELKILSRLLFDRPDVPAADLLAFCRQRWAPYTMLATHAVFEAIFWRRASGQGPEWLDALIRL